MFSAQGDIVTNMCFSNQVVQECEVKPSKMKKAWKKLFHKSEKGRIPDIESPSGPVVEEPLNQPTSQGQLEIEEPVNITTSVDEPRQELSDQTEAVDPTDDAASVVAGHGTPTLMDDFAFEDWNVSI